jgi:hypothetical protein
VDQETYELLVKAKLLLSYSLPSGDLAEILKRALAYLVPKLEAHKFGRTAHPRPQRGEPKGRDIPAEIRRIVSERDGDQCTFKSASGRRCDARSQLQFDHKRPLACGGKTTVDNVRLLCAPHNQHMARAVFGAEHVREQQVASRGKAAGTRERAAAATRGGKVPPEPVMHGVLPEAIERRVPAAHSTRISLARTIHEP